MRLELQQRLSQQLRAELEAERAERAGNRPAVKREEAPTLDLAALGPGSKIKQALSGPGPREAPGTASQADEERRSRMYVEQNAVTVPLLPPPKVVSVAGDDESSSILSPRSTDPYATVNTRVASTKQAVEAFPDQRKNRVLYLDASLDVPGEQQQSEHLGLLHEAPHGQGCVGSCSLSHLPLREEVLGREPLACRIAPAPGTSPWIPQAQAVLQARQTKELANGFNLDLLGRCTSLCLSQTTSWHLPQALHGLSGTVNIQGALTTCLRHQHLFQGCKSSMSLYGLRNGRPAIAMDLARALPSFVSGAGAHKSEAARQADSSHWLTGSCC